MTDPQNATSYLDVHELVARSGLSQATIWRLKRAGKIPFFQPGGKGGRVKFPADAIEVTNLTIQPESPAAADTEASKRLPGPCPKWMSQQQTNKNK